MRLFRKHATALHIILLAGGPLGLFVLTGASSADSTNRHDIPDSTSQQAAMKMVGDVFKSDYQNAKTASDKSALAQKMIQSGTDTETLSEKYALFKTAGEIAIQAGDTASALRAAQEMAACFKIDGLKARAGVLVRVAKSVRLPKEQEELVSQYMALIDEAVHADRYDLCEQLGESAVRAAVKAKNATLRKQVAARNKVVEDLAKEYARLQPEMTALQQSPLEPEVNAKVGTFRCLWKGDWDGGLHMLALGNDPKTKPLGVAELHRPTSAEQQQQLADDWWTLAEENKDVMKDRCMERAVHWYRQVLPNLVGLDRKKVEGRLEEFENAVGSETMVSAVSKIRLRLKNAPDAVKIGDHYYKIFWVNVPWTQAKAACESIGGYLACLETDAEREAVAALKGGKVAWVGGYRDETQQLKWINGEPFKYRLGGTGGPDYRFVAYTMATDFNVRPVTGRANYINKNIHGFVCEWDE